MDKRYQVFVSSTYADLQAERREVIQALMEMDCIPAGMELFPAADEEQWAFIRRVIDDCDYYLLIIGGRYGTVTEEGISYTELEYDYAVARGIPVIAFVHQEPDQLPIAKSDIRPDLREKLAAFRQKVSTGRLVRPWTDPKVLAGQVALSLQKTIKTYPGTGWVRATGASTTETLAELNELRKRNDALRDELATERARLVTLDAAASLAPLDTGWQVTGTYWPLGNSPRDVWQVSVTWSIVFASVAPFLLGKPSDHDVKAYCAEQFFRLTGKARNTFTPPVIDEQNFQTIKMQLIAHQLITVDANTISAGGPRWSLTPHGEAIALKLCTVDGQGS